MIGRRTFRIAAAFRWTMAAAVVWAAVLVLTSRGTARLRRSAEPATASAHPAVSADSGRLAALRAENERLRAELRKIPELAAKAEKLRAESAGSTNEVSAAHWAAESNAVQNAIEQTKRDMAVLGDWFREHTSAKQREAARARLAERANEASGTPAEQEAALKETLRQAALARKNLAELGKEFRQLDKSQQAEFRPKLQEAQAQWGAAYEKLGKDIALFRELPITNNAPDLSKAVMMRSILPDDTGRTMTVYLDGTIDYSATSRE